MRAWEQLRRAWGVVTINKSLVTGDPDQHMESLGVVAIINSSLVTEGGGVPLKQIKGAGRGAERLSTEELGTLEERDRWAVGGRRTWPLRGYLGFCMRRSIVSLVVTLTFSSLCQFGF